MNLTRFTDYSLRILMYAATRPPGELSNIQEIATVYRISHNHLMKSVHRLAKLGLLETIRGRGGGFRLAKQPEEIGIGWVVRHTEENWHMVECFDEENGFCLISPSCRLQRILRDALDAYLQVLDEYTLADLIVNQSMLKQAFDNTQSDSNHGSS